MSRADEYEWLKNLKVGDQVVIPDYWHPRVLTVERLTSTQIIAGRQRYRRDNGRLKGGSYRSSSLSEATPEALHMVKLARARSRLNMDSNQIRALDDDLILKLIDVWDQHVAAKAAQTAQPASVEADG